MQEKDQIKNLKAVQGKYALRAGFEKNFRPSPGYARNSGTYRRKDGDVRS